jgi:hypothetical protein
MRPFLNLIFLLGSMSAMAETVPFIHDDFAKALSQGREKNLPIFVEAWAPW